MLCFPTEIFSKRRKIYTWTEETREIIGENLWKSAPSIVYFWTLARLKVDSCLKFLFIMLQRSFQKISIRCKSRSFVPHWLSRLSMNFIDIKLNSAWIGQICRHNQLLENASNVVKIEGKNSSIIVLFQVKTGYREILIQLYDHWVLVDIFLRMSPFWVGDASLRNQSDVTD